MSTEWIYVIIVVFILVIVVLLLLSLYFFKKIQTNSFFLIPFVYDEKKARIKIKDAYFLEYSKFLSKNGPLIFGDWVLFSDFIKLFGSKNTQTLKEAFSKWNNFNTSFSLEFSQKHDKTNQSQNYKLHFEDTTNEENKEKNFILTSIIQNNIFDYFFIKKFKQNKQKNMIKNDFVFDSNTKNNIVFLNFKLKKNLTQQEEKEALFEQIYWPNIFILKNLKCLIFKKDILTLQLEFSAKKSFQKYIKKLFALFLKNKYKFFYNYISAFVAKSREDLKYLNTKINYSFQEIEKSSKNTLFLDMKEFQQKLQDNDFSLLEHQNEEKMLLNFEKIKINNFNTYKNLEHKVVDQKIYTFSYSDSKVTKFEKELLTYNSYLEQFHHEENPYILLLDQQMFIYLLNKVKINPKLKYLINVEDFTNLKQFILEYRNQKHELSENLNIGFVLNEIDSIDFLNISILKPIFIFLNKEKFKQLDNSKINILVESLFIFLKKKKVNLYCGLPTKEFEKYYEKIGINYFY
ncbi:hypothetical protein [Mycoplasma sp. 1654_15]|uniref:hypothetical protein n=1 Tax=Mycoplasma sp. 1654_15 TaxID=2725994 RepID=UPI00144960C2|nr:hypothetical protein [Mycoplasma sp. 1654_15]QJB71334.1 hypothetical protein HF996_02485 [Mycoplasma sp. 1654_15]